MNTAKLHNFGLIERKNKEKKQKGRVFFVILQGIFAEKHFCNLYFTKLKWLKHIINIVVWTVICLYILVITLLRIPAIQGQIGEITASAISKKLGTRVEIGRVDLGFFNRLIIDDVLVFDQKGKEMLRSARLSVKISILSLLEDGRIYISSAQVFGAHAKLYKTTAQAKPNYQFAIDSLASNDTSTEKGINLKINSFLIRHSSVSYDKYYLPPTHSVFNPAHINIADITATVQIKALKPDSININVRKLAFKEQSGLSIDRLTCKLIGGHKQCQLSDFQIKLPHSTLYIPILKAYYRHDNNKKAIDTSTLRFNGEIRHSKFASQDFTCFLPSINSLHDTLYLAASFQGNSRELNIPSLLIHDNKNSLMIDITGNIKKHPVRLLSDIRIKDISVSADFIERIGQCLSHTQIKLPDVVKRLGNIQLSGKLGTTPATQVYADCDLSVNPGKAHVMFSLANSKDFSGRIETSSLDINKITGNDDLGILAAALSVGGNIKDSKNPTINAKGKVDKFSFKGYDYHDITIDGIYKSNSIDGQLNINDNNIKLLIKGNMQKSGHSNNVNISANVNTIRPKILNLTSKWGDAQLGGNITANIKATNLNNAVGQLKIENFKMSGESKSYLLDRLFVSTGFNEGMHYLTLSSDFGHAELVGHFDYATIGESLANFVRNQLPTLPGLPQHKIKTDNDFLVRAEINKTDWLEDFLLIPIHADHTITLNGKVNDREHNMYLNCTAPDLSYKDVKLEDISVAVTAPKDKIDCQVSATKVNDDDNRLTLAINSSAHDNALTTSFKFHNNTDNAFNGIINADAVFTKENGQQTANISVSPSYISIGETQWQVSPAQIVYSKNHVNIDNFLIKHGNQHIAINGTASTEEQDSLKIDLNGIDVNYVLNLVNFHSVDFGGLASGRAYITAPFADFGASAKLQINHFTFENGRMGVLNANVAWNKEEKQIDIDAIANDGPDAMTYINGYVSTSRSYIDLGIKAAGTRMDFMRSFTKNFMDDIGGHAKGEVHVAGPLSTINLTGQLVVDGYASITTTGCTYTMRNDTVNFIPDDIILKNAPIYDKNGNRGLVSGGIHHKHLTHLTYDLDINARNMLVYDFKDFGENTFYGTVYGSGNVDIHGLSDELSMNVNITPRRNSSFVYNVSNPDAISDQEFIKWNDVTFSDYNQPDTAANTQTADDKTSSDTYINFLINMTPDATVRLLMDSKTKDYITLNGTGTLRATYYNKGSFNMYGTYRVSHGTYGITIQNIIKKNFIFNDGGTIAFQGNPYEAALNLQAVYTVNGVSLSDLNIGNSFSNNTIRVNCLMNITGQPSKPVVDFDIDMPTVSSDEKQMIRSVLNSENEMNQQVLYLLGIGRFYPQEANNAMAQNERQQSQTSLAMQSLLSGTISSQINNVLSQVIKSNNWNFGANISTGDEGWNNAEYEGLLSGRLLNNRLLINGQFGYRDNASTANTSFIGDFDIRYLLFPNGNIAIKMYNQTNDRYFTKSSLNTQGIGLIMKKDFTNIKDLFGAGKKRTAQHKKEKKK